MKGTGDRKHGSKKKSKSMVSCSPFSNLKPRLESGNCDLAI